ncbi:alginate O-acetyltransferase AlgX-related protein [Saccharothrix syringae]|uniref:AlgX/AlgJ SGNH hydrolase-like domain-containing protein n=1 Tax=Saccharothrix syringae TaxID=103733 RepID=A0A5Q0GRH1_SACSY|nr:hypothetical protein [Saccharothrix syringae]QFZ16104.1 hypothetical protein EKG83_00280 [Saccharothrix syringae]
MSSERIKGLPVLHESFLPREHALYRPRHGDRQRPALVAALVFFCAPLLLLGVGVRPAEFENRELAPFPSVTDGWAFFTGLGAWADDHVPLRDAAVAAADGVSRGVFGEPLPRPEHGREVAGPIQVPPPKDPSLDRPEPTAYVDVIEGKGDWLYLGFDVKGACEPALPPDEVFARLARLRRAVETSGRRFVLLVAPNKSTAVPENLPARYFGRACADRARDQFWSRLVGRTGALDVRSALRQAAAESGGPLYTDLDTHWNHQGGVVAARAVAEAVRPGVTRDWEVNPTTRVRLPADLPLLLGRKGEVEVQQYEIEPDGQHGRTELLRGDPYTPQRVTRPAIPGVVDEKVGLLGDSFAFYVAQYLVAGFADITLQHGDAVNADPHAVARMLAEQDVVVFEAAERNLVGGINPLLQPQVLDVIEGELAKSPR